MIFDGFCCFSPDVREHDPIFFHLKKAFFAGFDLAGFGFFAPFFRYLRSRAPVPGTFVGTGWIHGVKINKNNLFIFL